MEKSYFGLVELIFTSAVVFGFVIWQLKSVERDKAKLDAERKRRAEAEAKKADAEANRAQEASAGAPEERTVESESPSKD